MEVASVNNAKNFPVPNVQELASKTLKDIPNRYIRPEIHADVVSVNESSQIPVIDMSKLAAGNAEYQTEMSRLHQACKEWGYFQLINHGATATIEKMKVDIHEFFKLPLEEKMVYAQIPGSLEGYGQVVAEEDQQLDWNDMLFLCTIPESSRNMRYWPKNPPSFRSNFEEYTLELHRICTSVCELMAKNLGVEFRELACMQDEIEQTVRTTYYPPCPHPDKVIGGTPHSDVTLLTLLVQASEVDGLQIRKNGKWVPVRFLPGAIVVNTGDLMEIMSNGEYESIEHRAVVNSQKERISIAALHRPADEAIIGPLPALLKENGAKYKTIKYADYLQKFFGGKINGRQIIESMKIE
ncbi:OLC1v1031205C1 [Oldenlandia corymbosa var. corymbosa]|uniref:OLC1v1031205C1 n=1 Tax=Oldenlandia corymbosa var. corymbosa TaxID=529605 RepID=A0AAV1CHZ3_OLDCO|nr:OLC1v1031205C1 [Oldenlandia corymbosa var. corymbosa]